MTVQPTFVLDGATLAAIGAIIGTLAGAISFLFKQLISAKDAQISALIADMKDQRDTMMVQIEELKVERNHFRDRLIEQRRAPR
jgi:ABC-type lipoprotein release transport system permease subunit